MNPRFLSMLKGDSELWDLYTRREEYSPPFLDKYQRFPYYLSKDRNVMMPRVSSFLIENGLEAEYPERKKFAVCLTHDIDQIYFTKKEIGLSAAMSIAKHQVKSGLKTSLNMIRRWKPLWNFKDIMALEEKYNAKSSFYFKVLNESEPEFNYRIEDLENELGNVTDKGWEVGLHGTNEAHENFEQVRKQKERLEKTLGKKVTGYRSHHLKFRVPDTWAILEKAGFEYDTTLSYSDVIGFRNGMCHPFNPFNLNTNKELIILEIPLIIQDKTLGEACMCLFVEKALDVIKNMIDIGEKYNGVITILWHNNHMFDENMPSTLTHDENLNKRIYEKILEYCHQKNAWITSGKEICEQWKHSANSK